MTKISKLFSIKLNFLLISIVFGSFFLHSTFFTSLPKYKELNTQYTIQKNGLLYIKEVNALIIQTQRLRGLTNIYLNKKSTIRNAIEKQNEIVFQIKNNIIKLNEKIGTKKTNIEITEILNELELTIKDTKTQSIQDTFNSYTSNIERLLSFISFIKHEYLLYSNSNNEIQLLLDLYINNIPFIIEVLGKNRGITAGILADKRMNMDKITNINHLVDLIKFNDKQIKIKIDTLFKYDNYLKKQLENNIDKISNSANKYYNLYNVKILNNYDISSKEFFDITSEIIEEYNSFLANLYQTLTKEIMIKKNNDIEQVETNILIHLLMAIFSIFIFYLFYKSFMNYIIKLKNAEKTKSNFLSNMSHEIRTPLNAIIGFITLLKDEEKDNKKLDYITTVQNSSSTLLNIINDILDFSKIENAKLEIVPVAFDPHKEFHDILNLFNANAITNEINLSIKIKSNLPKFLFADNLRLRQVTSNLISNAIKFTNKKGSVRLSIAYNKTTKMLLVSVRDSGIGIAKNKHQQIFKVFSQSDNSITRKYGGTGLGLSISSKLVDLLEGKLKLKSIEGKGSIFYFAIPANEVINKNPKPIEAENLKITDNIEFNSKILLVEDNEANQMFMKIILKKYNLKVEVASDGIEAFEKFTSNTYDLILMDENMPHKNGIEATQDIIEYEKENHLVHTPIVALTANALQGDKEVLLKAGMDEYLSKPLNRLHLLAILNKYLTK